MSSRIRIPSIAGAMAAPLAALALNSCMIVGENYAPPELVTPDTWHQSLASDLRSSTSSLEKWWTKLNDPTLDELIEKSADANPSVKIALERVVEARAARRVARSALFPSVDGEGGVSRSKSSANTEPRSPFGGQEFDQWTAGANAGWELDFFGGVRRAVESADASAEAIEEAYRDTMVTLYAEVAQSYIDIRTFERRLELAQNNIEVQRSSLGIAEERFGAGLVPELDVSQARSILASTRAAIPFLREQRTLAINRLAALLGTYPNEAEKLIAKSRGIPSPGANAGIGLPADLLRSRPDVRQAERELAAQTARIGVAEADLYPRFALGGTFAFQSANGSNLLDSDSSTYSFGPSFRWNLFNAGRVRNLVKIEESRTKQALYAYENAVLKGVEDVENNLASTYHERDRYRALVNAVDAAQQTVDLVTTSYTEGLVDFQNVLDAQRTILTRQDEAAVSKGRIASAYVRLYKALGGGTKMSKEITK
ncbi:efflux transporter outer membrane subunit [Sulfuriroseicoccus oceanibius]|uniref:Efflux transporter outer membrane subunit n=1 Tax=Sulfuriroseicoccus oceanibius TaxID=2707525 RepID=A0A6B3LAY3_9BACT|nr:efflux transporter outer membrane subunit [Sulfuriroseicoccus oceanibius]QQL45331.1 efflux transporter outer membrane subunit [Sulfuriroseicoccus oceanibius]